MTTFTIEYTLTKDDVSIYFVKTIKARDENDACDKIENDFNDGKDDKIFQSKTHCKDMENVNIQIDNIKER